MSVVHTCCSASVEANGNVVGRNGGHFAPRVYEKFQTYSSANGEAEAVRAMVLEEHTVDEIVAKLHEYDMEDAVETDRSRSGTASSASVGLSVGGGDASRSYVVVALMRGVGSALAGGVGNGCAMSAFAIVAGAGSDTGTAAGTVTGTGIAVAGLVVGV